MKKLVQKTRKSRKSVIDGSRNGVGNKCEVSETGPDRKSADASVGTLPLIEVPCVTPVGAADTSASVSREKIVTAGSGGNGDGNQGSSPSTSTGSTKSQFDVRKYERRTTNFDAIGGGLKTLTRIPVKKPPRDWWVRVHPSIACELGLYEDKSSPSREFYLVEPEFCPLLGNSLVYRTLFLAITSQGQVFWWPLSRDSNGRSNSWSDSALEAVQMGRNSWVRIQSNMAANAYDTFTPSAKIPDPEWPDEDMNTLLEIAFKGKIIDNPDHHVIKLLQGRLS